MVNMASPSTFEKLLFTVGLILSLALVGAAAESEIMRKNDKVPPSNVTVGDTTQNKTDSNATSVAGNGDGKVADESSWPEWKVCLVIAAILSVIAFVTIVYVKNKAASSGYASGDNMPKPLAGMKDDF